MCGSEPLDSREVSAQIYRPSVQISGLSVLFLNVLAFHFRHYSTFLRSSTGFTVTAAIYAVVQLQVSLKHAYLIYYDVLSAYVGTCGSGYLSPHFVLDLLS